MKIKRVKVTQASQRTYWYAKNIGQEFYVSYAGNHFDVLKYKVIPIGDHNHESLPNYLDKNDVEVLEEFDGNIIEKISISICRN